MRVEGAAAAVKQNLYNVNIEAYKASMTKKPATLKTRARPAASKAAPARPQRKPGAPRAAGASETAPYHHGDLHDALLKAAETVLERDGLGGLTLRAVAREAGVSHAGFRQFNVAMAAAGAIDAPPLLKAMARAKAYVAYAQAHPGMYGLMFRTERLDMTRPSLHEAAGASFAGLAGSVGVSRQQQGSNEALSLEHAAAIARAWSLVHGFTTLLLDGRLNDILKRLPKGNNVETLLDAMLRSTVSRPPGP